MTGESNAAARRAWMMTALAVSIPHSDDAEPRADAPPSRRAGSPAPVLTAADPDTPLSKAARDPRIWAQPMGAALQAAPGEVPPLPMVPAVPTGQKTTIRNRAGNKIEVVTAKDGRVALTTDPPPVEEITFSGGGGKGAALPGAVKALEETGMLKAPQPAR